LVGPFRLFQQVALLLNPFTLHVSKSFSFAVPEFLSYANFTTILLALAMIVATK
jgi:hypothetical protein